MIDARLLIEGVPVRLVCLEDPARAGARGTVFFYHGLFSEIAGQTRELHGLAARGFLAVGVDNVGHGRRRWPDLAARFAAGNPRWGDEFLDAVWATAREAPLLVDALLARGWAREDRLGLGGISMGGCIAYAAVLLEPRIRAAAPILGTPVLGEDRPDSPHRHPEVFWPVAILSQNAGEDRNVPPAQAARFHEALAPFYSADPGRQAHRIFEGCGHFMPEPAWDELWSDVLAWYDRHL